MVLNYVKEPMVRVILSWRILHPSGSRCEMHKEIPVNKIECELLTFEVYHEFMQIVPGL